tara:strand:+ start:2437 stop:3054 length:618 start_codon:yes stop_codon:yes gene_type:complete
MKNIAKAIIQVMKEVKGMEKNSNVGSGRNSYNGTKDQDVKEVFNDALAKNGLCILPIDIQEETQIDRWEQEYNGQKQQKQSVFTKVTTKYMLLHDSGESIELAGYGHGVDPQDKGAGKATTYALKNCLLYTFLTPVGKIDDTETTHSENIPTPAPKEPAKKQIFKEGGFDKALNSDQKTILSVLSKYELTPDQKKQLTEKIKTAK